MIIISKKDLTVADVVNVARNSHKVDISAFTLNLVEKSHILLHKILKKDKLVYGINTGFGIFSEKRILESEIKTLNRNLILSHAVATGRDFEEDVVRAAMLIRVNTLAKGYSGIRPVLVQTIVDMLNKKVTPVIPSQGSLGSSGDLCLLSHLALVATKDTQDNEEETGKAYYDGQIYSGKTAMRQAEIERIELGPKEGLALTNGATFSAAIGCLGVADAEYLLHIAELAAALSYEALCGCTSALDLRLHELRKHKGQIETAKNIKILLEGSTFTNSKNQVQDAYSLRCVPQVHGAVRDAVNQVKDVLEREINAVTDNPLFFEPGVAISGGNFHGEPIGLVMDYLSIAMCELGAISERRTYRLTDAKMNHGLPEMLVEQVENAGLNSGLMIPQYTAASLVLENQTLATPDSIKSLPTSAGQEDFNANSTTAARHLQEINNNLIQILSIELYTAAHAIDLRRKLAPGILGKGTQEAYQRIRSVVPYLSKDSLWGQEIKKVSRMISYREL